MRAVERSRAKLTWESPAGEREGCGLESVPNAVSISYQKKAVRTTVRPGEYHTLIDRRMLYVACTRGMHKLSLTYVGEPSRFLPMR